MARRRPRRAGSFARWIPWTPALAEHFRLVKLGDWSPPAEARLTGGLHRQTLSARFTARDGSVLVAKLRLVRDLSDGAVYVAGEELQFPTMTLGPKGAEA